MQNGGEITHALSTMALPVEKNMSHWALGSYARAFSNHFLLLISMQNTTFPNYENPSKTTWIPSFPPTQMSLELKQVKHNLFTRGSVYNSFLTAMLRAFFFFLCTVICFTDFESSFSSPQTLNTLLKKVVMDEQTFKRDTPKHILK